MWRVGLPENFELTLFVNKLPSIEIYRDFTKEKEPSTNKRFDVLISY